MQRKGRKWRTYIPGDEADCTGALSDRALSPLCLAFLLVFSCSFFQLALFFLLSLSLFILCFSSFLVFHPISACSSLWVFFLFVPLVFLWVFFLLFFSFFCYGFYCDLLLECFVSGVVAAEDGAVELLLKTKSRACYRNTQVSPSVFHLSSSSSWPFSGFYKARECHAVAQQMKRTRRIVTIIMKTHHGAGETSIFHSGLMKRRRWTVLFQTALFLGWEWSFAVWSQKSWNCVIRPPYSGKSPFNFAPG